MRPIHSQQRWFAAAVCLLASASFTSAQEGVVRISDAATRPGVVKMNAAGQRPVQQTAHGHTVHPAPASSSFGRSGYASMSAAAVPAAHVNMYRPTNPYQQTGYAPAGHTFMPGQTPCVSGCCESGFCGPSGCDTGCCPPCATGCGDICYDGCNARSGRRNRRGSCNSCESYSYGDGYRKRMWTVFAKATPKNSDGRIWPKRWWHGQQLNYQARNQRLSNTLFGWLVPSGCNGQGCPPIGKYHVTYAHDPGYTDPRDSGQAYGAQGYGVPVTIPLAPNVRHAYNYSWGTPSSRITPMGQYSPGLSNPQPLYHQSW